MGRIFFFIREGMRALRRSAAPSLAAIVTVAITVLLLGVLIPVLQTANGQTNELRSKLEAIPHVASVEFVNKDQALKELGGQFEAKDQSNLVTALPGNR